MALSRVLVLAFACIALTGCSQGETVVDVKTPAGNVEVTKDKADGSVEVKVEKTPDSATKAAEATEAAEAATEPATETAPE
jgi:proline racemase